MISFGNRPRSRITSALFRPYNYRSLVGIFRTCPHPVDAFRRYVFAQGSYPHAIEIRTPLQTISAKIYNCHDMRTINEIFCREDYWVQSDIKVVVDIGANIGISALYFLTRNPQVFCYLYEPVPANLSKLEENVKIFSDRVEIIPFALGDREGMQSFSVESTGRYGGFQDCSVYPEFETTILPCKRVRDELDRILAMHDYIDVLKIDAEGAEAEILNAIRPEQREKIRLILYEGPGQVIHLKPGDSLSLI